MIRKIFISISILLALMISAYAQKRAFTIEDLYRIKNISGLQISPDGKSIIYVVSTSDLPRGRRTGRIWIMDIGSTNAREITTQNAFSPQFFPDGSIAFLAVKDGGVQLFLMPPKGGEWKQLTN